MDTDALHYYKAVECTGRQDDSDVYVFGPTLQFDASGVRIPSEKQQYVWIPHIISKLGSVVNPLPNQLPDIDRPLTATIKELQSIAGDNTLSGVTLLSKEIIIYLS